MTSLRRRRRNLRALRCLLPVLFKNDVQGVTDLLQGLVLPSIKNIPNLFAKVLEIIWARYEEGTNSLDKVIKNCLPSMRCTRSPGAENQGAELGFR